MIYTSYFGQLRNFPSDKIPVAICGKSPEWYHGLEYKKLAPKYAFFQEWKKTHDNTYYIEHFHTEVLQPLQPETVVKELEKLIDTNEKDIILLCYEKPSDFCHRHLVADWLNQHGIPCKELEIGG